MIEIELHPTSSLVGQTVSSLEVGGGFVVVAIKRNDGSLVRDPQPDERIHAETCSFSSVTRVPFPCSLSAWALA